MLKKLAVGSLVFAGLVACGSSVDESSDSKFVPSEQVTPGNDAFGEPGSFPNPSTPPSEPASCATQVAKAEPSPLSLVFMFDRSGSMTAKGSQKWTLATQAVKAFFESPNSTGTSASLAFFPEHGTVVSGKEPLTCSPADYATPRVPMTALPSAAFAPEIDAHAPAGGDTPTGPALSGALAYADSIAKSKGGSVAVVLVTDGLPDAPGCGIDVKAPEVEIPKVRRIAADAAATTPTYVIGVGDLLTNLNEIAAGGGTKSAFIVSAANTATLQADLLKALQAIRTTALACDYTIPAPPSGKALDRDAVNVEYTPAAGAPATLAYNPTCEGGAGWRYDDANRPTRVVMCASTCDQIKAQPGKVDIVFACTKRPDAIK